MKVKSIAECSILQYFWPALSDNGLENHFLRVAILHRFYCTITYLNYVFWFTDYANIDPVYLNPRHAESILCTTLLPNFYPFNLQHSNYYHLISIEVESSVDPHQMASSETSWSGSTMFLRKVKSGVQHDKG